MTNSIVVKRTSCRLCGSDHLDLCLTLPAVPIISPNVEDGDKEGLRTVLAPLDNYICRDCGLIQLIYVVDPSLIYRDYLYRTSISTGLSEHFSDLAQTIIDRTKLPKDGLVVEFGSNDGTLLSFFQQFGAKILGIDPAREIAKDATERGIPTRADFFTRELSGRLREELGAAKIIISNNCMANIDDLDTIFDGIRILLDDDGVFVFETQYALNVFNDFLADVIYHEHISCFSVLPVAKSLTKFGLEVFDAERIDTKGGSIRFWIQKAGGPKPRSQRIDQLIAEEQRDGLYDIPQLQRFSAQLSEARLALHRKIDDVRGAGGTVAAFGSSVGCVALIHLFELQDKIDYVLDDTPFKDQLVGPNYQLAIHHGSKLPALNPQLTIVLAWRYAEKIASKQEVYLQQGGTFAVVLPRLRYIQHVA